MVRSVAEDELSSQRSGAKQVQRDRHRDREREVHPSEDQEQRDGDPQSGFPAKRRPSSVGSRFSIASDSRFRMVRVHGVTELVYRIKALRGPRVPVGRENPLAKDLRTIGSPIVICVAPPSLRWILVLSDWMRSHGVKRIPAGP